MSGSFQPQQPVGYETPQIYQRHSSVDNSATPETKYPSPYPPHQGDDSDRAVPWSDSAGESDEPGYRTWDFLLLAKSRLQLHDPYTSDEDQDDKSHYTTDEPHHAHSTTPTSYDKTNDDGQHI